MSKERARLGFTLVEILMTLALVGIVSALSVDMYDTSLNEARFDATYKEMLQLRKAILGDLENTTIEGERIRFGYIGDVGTIPTTAQGLRAVYSQPSGLNVWAVDSASKLGVGWNGPYVVSSTDTDFAKDAWGRDYVYVSTTTVPYILSYGADGVIGGTGVDQDIQVDLPISQRISTIHGQITTSGSVYQGGAYVTVYYAGGSAAVSSQNISLAASDQGAFTFSNIPFGVRTVKVQVPSSTNPTITIGPVTFAVDNQAYMIPTNALEVNPLEQNATNCNTINNITYAPGNFLNDTTNNRVQFQLNIRNSIAVKTMYTINNGGAGGTSDEINQIGIGGIVYGCTGIIDLILYGGGTRSFNECAQGLWLGFIPYGLGYVDPDTSPNLTLGSTWGMPSGTYINGFMQFQNSTASLTTITLKLGCDTVTIQSP